MLNNDRVGMSIDIQQHIISTASKLSTQKMKRRGSLEGVPLPEDFVPSEYDVVCSWARQNRQHSGNVRFRTLVEGAAPAYIHAETKYEKTKVILQLIEKIRNDSPNGGFVKKDYYTGRWFEIGLERARDKVGHAVRKAADKLVKQHEKSKKRAVGQQVAKKVETSHGLGNSAGGQSYCADWKQSTNDSSPSSLSADFRLKNDPKLDEETIVPDSTFNTAQASALHDEGKSLGQSINHHYSPVTQYEMQGNQAHEIPLRYATGPFPPVAQYRSVALGSSHSLGPSPYYTHAGFSAVRATTSNRHSAPVTFLLRQADWDAFPTAHAPPNPSSSRWAGREDNCVPVAGRPMADGVQGEMPQLRGPRRGRDQM